MEREEKRFFTSRIIENLTSRINASPPGSERNVLFARKAFALARHSLIAEAKRIILDLRAINPNYEPRLSAWIMFAEGVIEHADNFDLAKSKDRIIRAHLVGQAANDPTLAGTAAAWLAYFEFIQGRYKESKEYLEKAFAWASDEDSEARSRAAMVVGFGFSFAGDASNARHWFQVARNHAIKCGDVAMQNTILFNSSAFHTSQLTLLDCTSTVDPVELNFAVMSAQSAGNLNTALGIVNQPSMVPMQRAELYIIEKKWQLAIDIFNVHLDSLESEGQSKWASKFFAQRAWCKANTGDLDGSRCDIEQSLATIDLNSDPDDLSILHFRVASSFQFLGDLNAATRHKKAGDDHLLAHGKHQALVKSYFAEIARLASQK